MSRNLQMGEPDRLRKISHLLPSVVASDLWRSYGLSDFAAIAAAAVESWVHAFSYVLRRQRLKHFPRPCLSVCADQAFPSRGMAVVRRAQTGLGEASTGQGDHSG